MSRPLRVLCYHAVSDAAAFGRQLDLLERVAVPVPLARVLEAARGGEPLPRRAVLLTFDDGHPSHLDLVGPLLAQRGLSGAFYVVLGLLGSEQPLWWDAVLARVDRLAAGWDLAGRRVGSAEALVTALKSVPDDERLDTLARLDEALGPPPPTRQLTVEECRELVALGHALGNHTWSHPLLDRCPDGKAAAEVDDADRAFRAAFPDQPLTFAYPNGNHDTRSVRRLAALGYELAFLFDHGVSGLDLPLEVSRLRVDERVPAWRLLAGLSGLDSRRVARRPGAVVPAQRRGVLT